MSRPRRRGEPEAAPTFRQSDVYKLALYGRAEYVRRWGEPSPELLAAVAAREDRHRRRAER